MRPTQLESRVREIRQHGSEGGAAYSRSDPYILKPLIVAQIPHRTPQSTPHSSVIPAQAGNRAPAMAHKQRGGSPRQDQPQIL